MRPAQSWEVMCRIGNICSFSGAQPGKSQQQPSPAQMQEMYAAFNAWKEKFKDNILDMGGKLMPGGKVVTASGAIDGPFVEAKEIVGGYMFVSAESIERAIEVAREMPGSGDAGIEHRDPRRWRALDRTEPEAVPARRRAGLVEHFFRHEYGRLVALLTRKAGVRHLDARRGRGPGRAARRAHGLDGSRPSRRPRRVALSRRLQQPDRATCAGEPAGFGFWSRPAIRPSTRSPEASTIPRRRFSRTRCADDMLRMLFICCDDAIPRDSQLVLALKTLCGFSTAEIALRLFTSEANVYKRLARARDRLRKTPPDIETPPLDTLQGRLPSVHAVLYLLFNEGYLSAHAEQAIRRELCDEAIRLATLLAEHPVGAIPETFALLALMHLHAARLPARCDGMGGLLLLEEQDRSLWDRERMLAGAEWLRRSADGDVFSRYHAEAGIAAEHCFAPSFG